MGGTGAGPAAVRPAWQSGAGPGAALHRKDEPVNPGAGNALVARYPATDRVRLTVYRRHDANRSGALISEVEGAAES